MLKRKMLRMQMVCLFLAIITILSFSTIEAKADRYHFKEGSYENPQNLFLQIALEVLRIVFYRKD